MNEQNTILIRTKLNAPAINPKIIKREKLLQKLQQSTDYKLTMITAPAGCGKTTAAVSYLANAGLPFAWLSVDESGNVDEWVYSQVSNENRQNRGGNFASNWRAIYETINTTQANRSGSTVGFRFVRNQ